MISILIRQGCHIESVLLWKTCITPLVITLSSVPVPIGQDITLNIQDYHTDMKMQAKSTPNTKISTVARIFNNREH